MIDIVVIHKVTPKAIDSSSFRWTNITLVFLLVCISTKRNVRFVIKKMTISELEILYVTLCLWYKEETYEKCRACKISRSWFNFIYIYH